MSVLAASETLLTRRCSQSCHHRGRLCSSHCCPGNDPLVSILVLSRVSRVGIYDMVWVSSHTKVLKTIWVWLGSGPESRTTPGD